MHISNREARDKLKTLTLSHASTRQKKGNRGGLDVQMCRETRVVMLYMYFCCVRAPPEKSASVFGIPSGKVELAVPFSAFYLFDQ